MDLTRKELRQSEESRIVGDITGSEEKSSLLLVQAGQFSFQFFVVRRIPGDVAGSTGANTVLVDGLTAKTEDRCCEICREGQQKMNH